MSQATYMFSESSGGQALHMTPQRTRSSKLLESFTQSTRGRLICLLEPSGVTIATQEIPTVGLAPSTLSARNFTVTRHRRTKSPRLAPYLGT